MTISLPMTALKHGNTLPARYITQTHMTDVLRYFAPSAKLFALCYIDMIYKVVMNHEEQYSIWPISRENPLGWQDVEKQEIKEECLAYIEEVWTDMRTLSLRRRMKNASED